MGLFDIFKKKTGNTDKNENILEKALRKAATEPIHRAAFYEKLLSEKLILLTDKMTLGEGNHVLEENTNVNILTLPDGKIPVFTSAPRIFDKGVIKKEVPFMEMKAQDLFEFTKGATFILNPYSDYGKELLPQEIESLLKGTILQPSSKKIVVEEDTTVQIGQPARYPTEIVRTLKALFAERPSVKAAYLGWIFNPSSADPPHLIFAFDIDGDLKEVITDEAGYIMQQIQPGEIIDIIQVDSKSDVSSYFTEQTTPFYVR